MDKLNNFFAAEFFFHLGSALPVYIARLFADQKWSNRGPKIFRRHVGGHFGSQCIALRGRHCIARQALHLHCHQHHVTGCGNVVELCERQSIMMPTDGVFAEEAMLFTPSATRCVVGAAERSLKESPAFHSITSRQMPEPALWAWRWA